MPLTAAEAKQLRYLLKKAGLEVPLDLSPRKRGRHERADDPMLAGLELFLRIAKRDCDGMSRKAALHRFFDGIYKRGKFGSSANAVVARFDRKLRERGFNKRDIKTLVPPGIDSSMIRIGFETTEFLDDKTDD